MNSFQINELVAALDAAKEAVASAPNTSDELLSELETARKDVVVQSLHKFRQAKTKFNSFMLDAQKAFTELLYYGELAGINMSEIEKAWSKINKSRRDTDLMSLLHGVSPGKVEPTKSPDENIQS